MEAEHEMELNDLRQRIRSLASREDEARQDEEFVSYCLYNNYF